MSVLAQIQDAALTPRSLVENEEIVDRGLATFVEVGLALMQIRDERQYREAGYDRFEDYCNERWQFGRHRANRLIEAAEVTSLVVPVGTTDGPVPQSERVARELAPVARESPEQAREVWAETVAEHGDKPTARQVAETRERVLGEQIPGQTDLVSETTPAHDDTEEVDAVVVDEQPTSEPEAPYDRVTRAIDRAASALLEPTGNLAHDEYMPHALRRMTSQDRAAMTRTVELALRRLRSARAHIKTYEESTNA